MITLGVLFLGFVLVLPTGVAGWFNGLPWTGAIETLALSVVTPFLLILGWRFLALRWSVLCLGALLVFKITLFLGSPSSGWLVKLHPLDGLPKNKVILKTKSAPKHNTDHRSAKNRHPKISKKGVTTDRAKVSIAPVHGSPLNQPATPVGRTRTNPRNKTPRVIMKTE
jgi:hypothetical protein